jgi:hypothetical protein
LANKFFARAPEGARARAGTALLCGALAVLGACGDDAGDDNGAKPATDAGSDAGQKVDGGGGTIDGGGGGIDGGKPDGGPVPGPDASAAIAEALDPTGIKASAERAAIVFPLACKNGVVCGQETNAQECTSDYLSSYEEYVAKGFSAACLDATLDLYSCFASTQCANIDDTCGPLYTTQVSICPKDAGI